MAEKLGVPWDGTAGQLGRASSLTCFYCGKSRPVGGKTLRCYLGRHRWVGVSKDGGEPYRECLFCRKYGRSPKFYAGGSG